MSDIELVIKIPEEAYENCIKYDAITSSIRKGIQKGTLLPKGHGRLIYADDVDVNRIRDGEYFSIEDVIDDAPTIIEADEECQ